jgi:hypothetical protein
MSANQEHTTRRFQSFDTENTPPRYDEGYECELPPEVRTELHRPKRARILGRPKPTRIAPLTKGHLYFVLCSAP